VKTGKTKTGKTFVRLEFALGARRGLFLIVRGPAPSCRTTAVLRIRGRKGFNSVPFSGRLAKRQLEPGVYGLTLSPTRTAAPGAPAIFVEVVSDRRTVPVAPQDEPSCDSPAAAASERMLRVLAPAAFGAPAAPGTSETDTGTATATVATTGGSSSGAGPALPDPAPDVKGEIVLEDLPSPPPVIGGDEGRSLLEGIASIAVLLAVGFLLVTMLALVTRFVRGTWNP
jgi:hypothetical protein